ncbi:MAG TPA: DUF4124 domain-containing protein [Candidatus Acidoferrales bacterium]|nr:DUF4124 domain-containing protein [Candidatus Acidoferrales bacterium]
MKRTYKITALGFWLFLFLGIGATPKIQAEEYYIYRDANGKLVISNQQPPRGSTIIKQEKLPEAPANQEPGLQEHDDMSRERGENPPEAPKDK